MPTVFVSNAERGHVSAGWLRSAHSFSFGHYINEKRRNFGALLVVNEDWIAPGQGFGEHPHSDMEIVTIPLEGGLKHGDSMGNGSVIRPGDVQAMSAGTGVLHSERNASDTEPVHLLQIWIVPDARNLKPRYQEKHFEPAAFKNVLCTVAARTPNAAHLQISQDASVAFGVFDAGREFELPALAPGRGRFVLLVDGAAEIGGMALGAGDSLEISEEPIIRAHIKEAARVLVIDVPMR